MGFVGTFEPSPSTALCPGGIHMFTLFNDSAPSWNLILFALLEVVLISWAYGVDKFLDHLEDMIPHFSPTAKVNLTPTFQSHLYYPHPRLCYILLCIKFEFDVCSP